MLPDKITVARDDLRATFGGQGAARLSADLVYKEVEKSERLAFHFEYRPLVFLGLSSQSIVMATLASTLKPRPTGSLSLYR